MTALVIGKPLAADLRSARNQTPLHDADGSLLGLFIPATLYQSAADRWADSVVDLEEIAAAQAETDYVSTAELVRKLRNASASK